MPMFNFLKIAAVIFLLILSKCYAKKEPDCNENIQGVWLGNDEYGTPVCGYPLNRSDFDYLNSIKNSLAPTNCFDMGYKNSFRVFWIDRTLNIAIPIETLTTCGQFYDRRSKLGVMKEFMLKMESVESGNPEADQKLGRACFAPYGVIARSLYAHNMCEIDSIELLHNHKHYAGSTYMRNDIKSLKASIAEMKKIRAPDFTGVFDKMGDYPQGMRLGCFHPEMTGGDQCIVYSKATYNEPDGTLMFYHMHCCCEDASKCSADVRSEGSLVKPILVFCPRDERKFAVFEGEPSRPSKAPYMYQVNSNFTQVISVDENVMSEVCSSKIVIKRTQYDGNTTKVFLKADITVYYGDDCIGPSKSGCVPINGDQDAIFPDYLEYCCKTLINVSKNEDLQWTSLIQSTNDFLGNEASASRYWWPISVKLFDAIGRCAYLPYKIRSANPYVDDDGKEKINIRYLCFFFYDDEKREVMNIWPEDQDYLNTLTDASDYDFEGEYRSRETNFDFRGPIPHFEWLFSEDDSEDNKTRCRLVGGCKRRPSTLTEGRFVKSNCSNFEMAFTLCRCIGDPKIPEYFAPDYKPHIPCDVQMATDLKNGQEEFPTQVPYCNVGQEDPVIIATTHPYQFYCYVSKTRDKSDQNKYTWDYGFYNASVATELYKYNEDTEHSELKCDDRHGACTYNGKTMFCCCLANYYDPLSTEENVTVCNNQSLVILFEVEKLLFEDDELGNTEKARRKCVSPTGGDSSGKGNSTSINVREMGYDVFLRPLCYFSIPVSKLGNSSANVDQYFYESHDRERNLGPFRTLCNTTEWATEEHTNGCACRLIYVEFGENEMACCCDAAAAEKYNEQLAQNKRLILASNFARQKPKS